MADISKVDSPASRERLTFSSIHSYPPSHPSPLLAFGFELSNLSGNLVSSEQLYLIRASGYRYNIHQERIDRGVLCTGEPEERLHGCGGVLVVRSRMGSTTMVLVTLSALTTATIEQKQTKTTKQQRHKISDGQKATKALVTLSALTTVTLCHRPSVCLSFSLLPTS